MNEFFIETYKKREIVVENAEGSFLITKNKDRFLDFLSGISINNLGYNNPDIKKAITNQLNKVIHPSNYYYTEPQIVLARKLVKLGNLDRVFFANSGAEANEAALVFLDKYRAGLNSGKNEVLIFDGSFLGRTYGNRQAAAGKKVANLKFRKIPFNNVESLQKSFSEKTLAVHLELVLGHGGVRAVSEKVISEIKKLCQKYKALIYTDEVQIGLGRLGEIFACKKFGLRPDIITIGKSLGGGLPLSAVLTKEKIAKYVKPGDYGSTMGGNSLACSAGKIVLDFLSNKKNITKIKNKGLYLKKKLLLLKNKYQIIEDIRVFGLMAGIQVEDGAEILVKSCFKQKLLLDSVNKKVLRMLPPFTVSTKEIDLALEILDKAFLEVKHG